MKAIPWLALVMALGGSLVAAGAYMRVRSATHAPPGTGSAEIESLRARVTVLEGELRLARDQASRLEREPKAGVESNPEHAHSGPPQGDLGDLKRRVEQLERQMAAGRGGPVVPSRNGPPNPALVEREKKQLMDTSLPERIRATSLSRLRSMGGNKTDEIVDAGLALLGQSHETNIRTLVIRGLQGAENQKLVPPMLALLKGDADEDVRDEAARVLGDYLDKPEAKAALEEASTGDASDKVKRRAAAMLAAPPKPK